MITIEARPDRVAVDPLRTAVLVIDMQNDFGSAGGMFERAGIDVSGIAAAAVATRPVLTAARTAGIPIVYIKMEHAPDLSDVGPVDGPHWIKHRPLRVGDTVIAPDGSESRILVRDTWNTEILEELTPHPSDLVVSKHRYSAFFETELDTVLKGLDAKYLLVTGCTTSICVESTVRDAMFRDYSCVVLEDCTAEPIGAGFARTNHEASLLVIETLFGWVSSSRAVLEALEHLPRPVLGRLP
jgi:ureidoacrylate peracid hydrolase